jgi:UDP-N-acetylmuramyl pentapeptide phosphotransferase/UDP-N-acetylglucosamine-1-phosphate transferase
MVSDNMFFLTVLSIFANYILVKKKFFFSKLLLDNDFLKPQAFHNISTPRSGGVVILLISVLYLFFFENITNFSYTVILLGTLFFLIGFFDDFKIKLKPELRLLFMFIISFSIIYLFSEKSEREKKGRPDWLFCLTGLSRWRETARGLLCPHAQAI